MTLVCEHSSFRYTRHEEEWPGFIFAPLLLRHGPPPPGIKYQTGSQRYYVNGDEAKRWHAKVKADCKKGIEDAMQLSHYKPYWREMHALNVKNQFIRWCLDARQ